MAEWLKAADCKYVEDLLRRFESCFSQTSLYVFVPGRMSSFGSTDGWTGDYTIKNFAYASIRSSNLLFSILLAVFFLPWVLRCGGEIYPAKIWSYF